VIFHLLILAFFAPETYSDYSVIVTMTATVARAKYSCFRLLASKDTYYFYNSYTLHFIKSCIKMIGAVSICHYGYQNACRNKFPTWKEIHPESL